MEFFLIFFLTYRAAFDLAPRKFIAQFRPRMNEILAEARAKIREIKKAKREAKKQRKEAAINQQSNNNDKIAFEEEEEEFKTEIDQNEQ